MQAAAREGVRLSLIHIWETMLDKALFLMRKEKVQIGLKAVLTETNQEWNSLELYEEIKKEHEYMQKNAAERKE